MSKFFRIISLVSITMVVISACKFSIGKQPYPLNLSSGKVYRFENFQSKYIKSRNIDVWVPSDYSTDRKYAVLYMNDGQMLFDSTTTWNHQEWGVDECFSQMIQHGKIRRTIVVGIWNGGEDRHSEYFPQKPFETLSKHTQDSIFTIAREYKPIRMFASGIRSDNYLKFITEELIPFINDRFSVSKTPESTFIAGSSMGGLISLYAVCEYPNVFGGAACLSTHWPGTFADANNPIPQTFYTYLEEKLPDPNKHKLYFDYGTVGLDSVYEPYQLKVNKIVKAKGFWGNSSITLRFDGKDHSEIAWKERLNIPVEFLLKR